MVLTDTASLLVCCEPVRMILDALTGSNLATKLMVRHLSTA